MTDIYEITDPLTDPAELAALWPEMHPSQVNKTIDHIDAHVANWIEHTTFVTVASANALGHMDISPKGDPAGFIKVMDPKTLVIPDRIGNHRGDTFHNVMQNPQVGLLLIVPTRKEVVRINGTAAIARDDALRDLTTLNGHRPDLCLVVRVQEAFFHCGKSMIRSAMWHPDKWGPVDGMPTYSQALKDHGDMDMALEDIEERMAFNEKGRLY